MSSILTNISAIAALQTVRTISSQLDRTQDQVSSGLRVAKASDNAAYWSVATTMKSDVGALSAARDAIGLGEATVDTTYQGMNSAIDVMSQIKSLLVSAEEPSVDKSKINDELTQLKSQLSSIADSSSFNGQNWLNWNSSDDSRDKSVVSSFVRDTDNSVAVSTMSYAINTPPPNSSTDVQYLIDNGGVGEYGILTSAAFAIAAGADQNYVLLSGETAPESSVDIAVDDNTTTTQLDGMLGTVEGMMQQMTSVAADLGSLEKRMDLQATFASNLIDSMNSGIGKLVDADMEQESSKLSAFQTQQQLAIQSLSIANSAPQNILSLFR